MTNIYCNPGRSLFELRQTRVRCVRNLSLNIPNLIVCAFVCFSPVCLAQICFGQNQNATGQGTNGDARQSAAGDASSQNGPAASQKVQAMPDGDLRLQEIMAAVSINGKPIGDSFHLVEDNAGHFYVTGDVLSETRLKVLPKKNIQLNGRDYYALDLIPGISYAFDQHRQSLALSIGASEFAENVLEVSPRMRLLPTVSSPGVFLNHDLEFSHTPGKSIGSGLVEAGFFSQAGILTSHFVSRNVQDISQFSRLDTQLSKDFPDRRAMLNIGDSISAANPWARQVYYAGVSWGSKFATDPSFIPYALPTLRGQAAEPSTVDLYVNNIRTMSQPVDSGPFTIPTIPVMTGQGDVQLVVTDVLGRQEVISASYINAIQLLRGGVSSYTYEGGTLRRGFGLTSTQYNSIFGEGTHRYGLSDKTTLNGRVELLPANQTLGFGVDRALLPLGLVSGGLAVSHSDVGAGALAYAEFQHQARAFGYSGTVQVTSSTFRQLGLLPGERPDRTIAQGQISHALWNRGSVAIGYLHKEARNFLGPASGYTYIPYFDAATASLNVRVGRTAIISTSVNYAPSVSKGNSATIALVVPLGARRAFTATGSVQSTGSTSTTEFTQQLPVGTGYGYDLRSTTEAGTRIDAGASYQNEHGTYDLEADQFQGQTSWRLTERSSLIFLQKQFAVSRWLNDSFGIVEADGMKNVEVFANNQYVAKTNSHGIAVIPTLVSYDRNSVRLDDSGVPMNVAVDLAERTVAPMPRSGVFLKFTSAKIEGALIQLGQPDGTPIPLGAEVRVDGDPTAYRVVLRGEVFVTNIVFPARLSVSWSDHKCSAVISTKPVAEPLPKIGPVTCEVN